MPPVNWEERLGSMLETHGEDPRLMLTARRRIHEQQAPGSELFPHVGPGGGSVMPTPANFRNLVVAMMAGPPIQATKTIERFNALETKDVLEVAVFEDGSTRVLGSKAPGDVLPREHASTFGRLTAWAVEHLTDDAPRFDVRVILRTVPAPSAEVTLVSVGALADEDGRSYRLEQRIRCEAPRLALEASGVALARTVVLDVQLMRLLGELSRERVRVGKELGVSISHKLSWRSDYKVFGAHEGPENGKPRRGGTRQGLRDGRSSERKERVTKTGQSEGTRSLRSVQADRDSSSSGRPHHRGGAVPPDGEPHAGRTDERRWESEAA